MSAVTSFSPNIGVDTQILILGTMPGVKSLEEQQYYAHPRNAFWPIMESIFNISVSTEYNTRLEKLKTRKVGLWDVLRQCERPGSLDQKIIKSTAEANDFKLLLAKYQRIHTICFNGKAAEQLFKQHVIKKQKIPHADITFIPLPSTSPANASMTLQQKMEIWQSKLIPALV